MRGQIDAAFGSGGNAPLPSLPPPSMTPQSTNLPKDVIEFCNTPKHIFAALPRLDKLFAKLTGTANDVLLTSIRRYLQDRHHEALPDMAAWLAATESVLNNASMSTDSLWPWIDLLRIGSGDARVAGYIAESGTAHLLAILRHFLKSAKQAAAPQAVVLPWQHRLCLMQLLTNLSASPLFMHNVIKDEPLSECLFDSALIPDSLLSSPPEQDGDKASRTQLAAVYLLSNVAKSGVAVDLPDDVVLSLVVALTESLSVTCLLPPDSEAECRMTLKSVLACLKGDIKQASIELAAAADIDTPS